MLLQADCLSPFPLASRSVHMVVTSVPYWAVREYKGGGLLGEEETPEAYVAHMVDVFAEVHRVLRDDGTLWLNIADTYCAAPATKNATKSKLWRAASPSHRRDRRPRDDKPHKRASSSKLKPKDLIGLPWMVAMALRDWGWYLRSPIIWHKPNALPGGYKDRPTTSYEYIFLLSKRRFYYYDWYAIREKVTGEAHSRGHRTNPKAAGAARGVRSNASFARATSEKVDMRNRRDVWSIPTTGYAGDHYATFPMEVPEPCILAGTSEKGVCPECGAPWKRQFEKTKRKSWHNHKGDMQKGQRIGDAESGDREYEDYVPPQFVGWEPGCKCGRTDTVPAIVFDPFIGTGTSIAAARRYGRRGIGTDISYTYLHDEALARALNVTPANSLTELPMWAAQEMETAWQPS